MSEETKKCPYCAETIKAEAIVCRFCGRDLTSSATPKSYQETNKVLEISKSKPICQFVGCELEADHKCDSCGKVFCVKHIASVNQTWSYVPKWLCAECLQKIVSTYKQITIGSFVIGAIGVVIWIAGASSENTLCVGGLFSSLGLGIGIGMGIHYLVVQNLLNKLFPQ